MKGALRKIVGRSFAPNGTRIHLECGHSMLSYSGRRSQKNMSCYQCAESNRDSSDQPTGA